LSIWILESFSLRKAAVEVRGAASGWAGWAIVHPDFAGIEKKRTETDNMLPFAHPESSCFRRLGSSNDSRATLTFNKYLNGLRVLCRNAFIAPNTR
jgi:hypothetical protein